jgi:hypothetical protein
MRWVVFGLAFWCGCEASDGASETGRDAGRTDDTLEAREIDDRDGVESEDDAAAVDSSLADAEASGDRRDADRGDAEVDASTEPVNPLGPSVKFAIESITVEPGEERQVCKTVQVPGGGLEVVRFHSKMQGLSHHFNLYKVIDGTRFDVPSPEDARTHDCAPAAEQLRGDAAYIFGAATSERIMDTPPNVAFRLEPGQRLILEFHAINYTLDPIEADVEVELVTAGEGASIEHHADIMWLANWGFFLPPGAETSDEATCAMPYDVEIFGVMSHFHELGTLFEIRATQDGETTKIYEDDDWAHPKYEAFTPPLSLSAGDELSWTCTWFNSRDEIVVPAKSSKDEMCMVFAAAYPKVGLSAEPFQCNVLY